MRRWSARLAPLTAIVALVACDRPYLDADRFGPGDAVADGADAGGDAASGDGGGDAVDGGGNGGGDAVDGGGNGGGDAVDGGGDDGGGDGGDAGLDSGDGGAGCGTAPEGISCALAGCGTVATCSKGACVGVAGVFAATTPGAGEALLAIDELGAAGAIVAGYRDVGGGGAKQGLVRRVDAAGATLWEHVFVGDGDDIAAAVVAVAGGTFAVAGSVGSGGGDALWLLLTGAGEPIAKQTYGSAGGADALHALVQLAGGDYVAAGVRHEAGKAGQGHLLGLDGAGGIAWQWSGGGADDDALYAVTAHGGAGFVAVGHHASPTAAWLVAVDAKGALRWQRLLANSPSAPVLRGVVASADGDLFAAGDVLVPSGIGQLGVVLRTDPRGFLRWKVALAHAAEPEPGLAALALRPQGGVVAAGSTGSSGSRAPWLLTCDAHGEDCGSVKVAGTSDVAVLALRRRADDGLWLAGVRGDGASSEGWLARTDAFGNVTCKASGACLTVANACDDGQPCTKGVCLAGGGCTQLSAALPCDDGAVCTAGDVCAAGVCKPGAPALYTASGAAPVATELRALALRAAGGLWSVGVAAVDEATTKALVERRDAHGTVVWSVLRGAPVQRALAVAELADASAVVVGAALGGDGKADVWVEREVVGADAASWSTVVKAPGEQVGYGVALGGGGHITVVGSDHGGAAGKGLVLRVGLDGVAAPPLVLDAGADQGLRAVQGDGAGLAACGHFVAKGKTKADMWLLRLDADHKVVASLLVGDGFDSRCLAIGAHGAGWVLAGTVENNTDAGSAGLVVAVDAAGKAQWNMGLGSSGVNAFHAVVAMPDGRVFAAGVQQQDPPGGDVGWLVPMSPGGVYIDEIYVDNAGDDALFALGRDHDGGLLVAGRLVGGNGKGQTYLSKRDPFANAACGKGACFAATFQSCDDGNACTFDSCDPSAGCKHGNHPDGTYCASPNDVCVAGACVDIPGDRVYHPGGSFWMGSDAGAAADGPAHLVALAGFAIDPAEVTAAQYAACQQAGACAVPKIVHATGSAELYNYGKPGFSAHPVNGVTWDQAAAYCAWAKGRLPTEAEWEFAARGACPDPTDLASCKATMPTYPWGIAPADCSRAIVPQAGVPGCGAGTTAPVGTKPDGDNPNGVHDLIGNVWEWVQDWYGAGYYAQSPGSNPTGPASGTSRVRRGGAYFDHPGQDASKQAWHRGSDLPGAASHSVGFRCASDVGP